MSEMVKRVARIINPAAFVFGEDARHMRGRAMEMAHKVIEAMREPTDEMATSTYMRDFEAIEIWEAMIDAALQDSPPIIRVEGETQ